MTNETSSEDKKQVITKDGMNLGELVSYNIDTSKWTVTSLIVEIRGDMIKQLKVKKRFLKKATIRIRTDQVDSVGDVVRLGMDLATLKAHL